MPLLTGRKPAGAWRPEAGCESAPSLSGFSGVYKPPIVPGGSHASADYIPGLYYTPAGPVYGMFIPSLVQYAAPAVPPAGFGWTVGGVGAPAVSPPGHGAPPVIARPPEHGDHPVHRASVRGHPDESDHRPMLARVVITDLSRVRPASFFRRLVSELIDLCVISVMLILIMGDAVIEILDKVEAIDPSAISGTKLEAILYEHADDFVTHHLVSYYVVMLCYYMMSNIILRGRTVGKFVCGLQVVQYPSGLPVTWIQIMIRAVVKTMEWAFAMLLMLMSAMCGNGRCLHDRLSFTHVVCIR